jgi:hypothetical protein
MSDYDTDILVWSERQGELLRRRAAGELVNEAELDWSNIAEEVESVGRSQLSAVQSLLRQALIHMLKAEAWPLSREVPHWRAEVRRFRDDAAEAFTLSMRQRINLARLYIQALRATPEMIDRPTRWHSCLDPTLRDQLGAVAISWGCRVQDGGGGLEGGVRPVR